MAASKKYSLRYPTTEHAGRYNYDEASYLASLLHLLKVMLSRNVPLQLYFVFVSFKSTTKKLLYCSVLVLTFVDVLCE